MPKLKPCQCDQCQQFAALALELNTLGFRIAAETIASAITWYSEDTSEGYSDRWEASKVDSASFN